MKRLKRALWHWVKKMSSYKPFSKKQLRALTWWCRGSPYRNCDALICDGAVRSGKTFCMSISFIAWSFSRFSGKDFAICGKTVRSLKRNVVTALIENLGQLGFECELKKSENILEVFYRGNMNRFYLFGGKDEMSASLIQGITLAGVFLDEVALMPRSFVEQALARCSVEGSKFWFTLSEKMLQRYEGLYSGAFYERFVKGRWVAASGAVYPFMDNAGMYCEVPGGGFADFAVSCDYGTVNPASFGLWGLKNGVWYRISEYYFNSRKEGFQKTDEEHYQSLEELIGGRGIRGVAVDPSAASFIELIKRKGKYKVIPAKNKVIDGIRMVSTALKNGEIRICRTCADSIREFSLYRWNEDGSSDAPIKENDHAMDDIRYFVASFLNNNGGFAAFAARR